MNVDDSKPNSREPKRGVKFGPGVRRRHEKESRRYGGSEAAEFGKTALFDGMYGTQFEQPVTGGYST